MVDACQAEAINDDPGVRRIQELIDSGSQRARTAYLMAARRGEPANEASALAHGLMTYALLKGMGATDLESPPALAAINDIPNADRDGDGVVTTEELRVVHLPDRPQARGQLPPARPAPGRTGSRKTSAPRRTSIRSLGSRPPWPRSRSSSSPKDAASRTRRPR